jgi:hypothetical protein
VGNGGDGSFFQVGWLIILKLVRLTSFSRSELPTARQLESLNEEVTISETTARRKTQALSNCVFRLLTSTPSASKSETSLLLLVVVQKESTSS